MTKKLYVTPETKVVEIKQTLMFNTSGLDEDFNGYQGESDEDDEAD